MPLRPSRCLRLHLRMCREFLVPHLRHQLVSLLDRLRCLPQLPPPRQRPVCLPRMQECPVLFLVRHQLGLRRVRILRPGCLGHIRSSKLTTPCHHSSNVHSVAGGFLFEEAVMPEVLLDLIAETEQEITMKYSRDEVVSDDVKKTYAQLILARELIEMNKMIEENV